MFKGDMHSIVIATVIGFVLALATVGSATGGFAQDRPGAGQERARPSSVRASEANAGAADKSKSGQHVGNASGQDVDTRFGGRGEDTPKFQPNRALSDSSQILASTRRHKLEADCRRRRRGVDRFVPTATHQETPCESRFRQ